MRGSTDPSELEQRLRQSGGKTARAQITATKPGKVLKTDDPAYGGIPQVVWKVTFRIYPDDRGPFTTGRWAAGRIGGRRPLRPPRPHEARDRPKRRDAVLGLGAGRDDGTDRRASEQRRRLGHRRGTGHLAEAGRRRRTAEPRRPAGQAGRPEESRGSHRVRVSSPEGEAARYLSWRPPGDPRVTRCGHLTWIRDLAVVRGTGCGTWPGAVTSRSTTTGVEGLEGAGLRDVMPLKVWCGTPHGNPALAPDPPTARLAPATTSSVGIDVPTADRRGRRLRRYVTIVWMSFSLAGSRPTMNWVGMPTPGTIWPTFAFGR